MKGLLTACGECLGRTMAGGSSVECVGQEPSRCRLEVLFSFCVLVFIDLAIGCAALRVELVDTGSRGSHEVLVFRLRTAEIWCRNQM